MGRKNEDKKITAFAAGAILGAIAGGPPGALVGGFLGALLEESSGKKRRR